MKYFYCLLYCIIISSICYAKNTFSAPTDSYSYNDNNDSIFQIVSYNVENLFDTKHDSLYDDFSFLPKGIYRWTPYKYYNKIEQISRVIANIGQWDYPDLVALCEIENKNCLQDIKHRLLHAQYSYIHFDCEDKRGIDVAILYRPQVFQIIDSVSIPTKLEQKTRDILYVSGITNSKDTLHVFVCHLPSMRGGKSSSDWKRTHVKHIIQTHIDSILNKNCQSNIIVMGDMNSEPINDLNGLHNCMIQFEKKHQGTYKYKGIWSCIDQFYVSSSLLNKNACYIYNPDWLLQTDNKYLGKKPKRSLNGLRYDKNGYSDHLPIIIDIVL